MIAGRGTSDHAAIYAQYLLETHLGLPTGLAKPSVTTVYDAPVAWGGGLVLAISQSGQSPDIVAVVRAARAAGALTVAITNDARSPLAAAAAWQLRCHAGRELAVPATKTYVAELAVVAALVAAVRPSSDLADGLARLPDALRDTLTDTAPLARRSGADGGGGPGRGRPRAGRLARLQPRDGDGAGAEAQGDGGPLRRGVLDRRLRARAARPRPTGRADPGHPAGRSDGRAGGRDARKRCGCTAGGSP